MEKRFFIILHVIQLFLHLPTLAQNIQGSYKPMADGEIRKQQVEYTVSEAMGENIVWDFSSMEQPDEDYTVKYTLAETGGNDSIIVGKEQQTRYYYRSSGTGTSPLFHGVSSGVTSLYPLSAILTC